VVLAESTAARTRVEGVLLCDLGRGWARTSVTVASISASVRRAGGQRLHLGEAVMPRRSPGGVDLAGMAWVSWLGDQDGGVVEKADGAVEELLHGEVVHALEEALGGAGDVGDAALGHGERGIGQRGEVDAPGAVLGHLHELDLEAAEERAGGEAGAQALLLDAALEDAEDLVAPSSPSRPRREGWMGEDGLEVDVVVAEAVGVDQAVHVRDLAHAEAARAPPGAPDGEARDVAGEDGDEVRMGRVRVGVDRVAGVGLRRDRRGRCRRPARGRRPDTKVSKARPPTRSEARESNRPRPRRSPGESEKPDRPRRPWPRSRGGRRGRRSRRGR
jgi:hypothetical protein